MGIDVFTLCDGAFNYSGKLTIVGTYDQLNVNTIPINVRVSLAIKLSFEENEIHNGSVIKVAFRNSLNNPVSADIHNTIGVLPDNVKVRHVAMAISAEIKIAEAGIHYVELYVDDTLMGRKDFSVEIIH